MAISYDGLTRNAWTGTWSTTGDHPIALNNEIRGGIHVVSGSAGDQLADIPGQRLQEGMLVYLQNSYGSFTGSKWYTYNLLVGNQEVLLLVLFLMLMVTGQNLVVVLVADLAAADLPLLWMILHQN